MSTRIRSAKLPKSETEHMKLAFPKRLAKEALNRAKARAGAGWTLLAPELQQALVCRDVMLVLGLQEGEKWKPVVEVINAMADLGLDGKEKP
jgi:hypothetical protein